MIRDYKKSSTSGKPKRWVSPKNVPETTTTFKTAPKTTATSASKNATGAKAQAKTSKKAAAQLHSNSTFSGSRKPGINKMWLAIAILVFFLILSYLVIFRDSGPKVTVTSYGRLADEFTEKGLLVKSEQVFYAPFEGKVTLLAGDGKRLPSGRPVVNLKGETEEKTFYSRFAGLVSFEVDGLENSLTPGMLMTFNQNYQEFRGKGIGLKNGDTVNAGRPLFKIVNNFLLSMIVKTPTERLQSYDIGEKVWIGFNNMTVIGYVKRTIPGLSLLVIQLERFPDELVNVRWVDVNVLINAFHGVILPRQCVTEEQGVPGVYRYIEGDIVFWPIKIIGGNTTEVVVTGIERGVEILVDPAQDIIKYAKRVTHLGEHKKQSDTKDTAEKDSEKKDTTQNANVEDTDKHNADNNVKQTTDSSEEPGND